MLNEMQAGAAIVDDDWRFRYLNPSAARLVGRPVADLLNQSVLNVVGGFAGSEIHRRLASCMAERRPCRFEAGYAFEDGTVGWFDINVEPVHEGIFVLALAVTEQHEAVEELRASEARFRAAFEAVRDPMAILGPGDAPDNRTPGLDVRWVNRAWREQVWAGSASPSGATITASTPGLGALVPLAGQATDTGQLASTTLGLGERLYDATIGQSPDGFVATLRDITDRLRRERELIASEERYRSLVAELDAVVTVQDVANDSGFVSGQTELLFGYSAEQLASPGFWRSLVVPEDRAPVIATWDRAQERRILEPELLRYELEYRILRSDDEIVWLNERMRAVVGDDGLAVRWYGVATDVTGRRRHEGDAAASREAFRALFENAPLYSMVVRQERDEAGQVVDWEFQALNQSAIELLGTSANQIVGRRVSELYGAAVEIALAASLDMAGGGRPVTRDIVLPANGRTYQVTSFGFGEDLCGLLALDVTESLRARATNEQLARMAALGQLAARVAHDFKNLLFGIELHLGLMGPDEPRDELVSDIDSVRKAVAMGTALSRQLLDFARPRPPTSVTDVGQSIRELRPVLERLAGHQISLDLRLPAGTLPAQIDDVHLQQVFLDLVLNARDATPGAGRIVIEAIAQTLRASDATRIGLATGHYVVIRVADHGSGIPPENLERIFEPYFTTKPGGSGTGLGLATAFATLQAAGGAIHAANQPGGGAIMTIYLRAPDRRARR